MFAKIQIVLLNDSCIYIYIYIYIYIFNENNVVDGVNYLMNS